ncbi:hypothetical protein PILCRDRAFT_815487 [Piloderma croceum F 1598]|uniref:Uncharacterized protein n=1 Tax=Piloderma croceum (strain F 1598) TaxID=765440 RepID=A0A0C3G8R2_PILCF|nr:hypothetical protein PILCRDRAFT_815487 [Piloderma croceum F 1598]
MEPTTAPCLSSLPVTSSPPGALSSFHAAHNNLQLLHLSERIVKEIRTVVPIYGDYRERKAH